VKRWRVCSGKVLPSEGWSGRSQKPNNYADSLKITLSTVNPLLATIPVPSALPWHHLTKDDLYDEMHEDRHVHFGEG
jgi:hypothetical protein